MALLSIIKQYFSNIFRVDKDGNLVDVEPSQSVLSQLKEKEELKTILAKTRGRGSRTDSVMERPPWRPGGHSGAPSRAYSRASTYIDDLGNKIDSKMIKERKAKAKKSARRGSKFDFGPSPARYNTKILVIFFRLTLRLEISTLEILRFYQNVNFEQ